LSERLLLVSAFRVGAALPLHLFWASGFYPESKQMLRISSDAPRSRRECTMSKGIKELTFLGANYALTNYAPVERLRDSDSTTSMNIAGRNY
jgi:hypothetical protein